jgi:NAD(P)H-hydrate epimerase
MIRVVTSPESAARDKSAIGAGIPSRALMQRAGAAAASEIALRYRDRLANGVLVLAGPGNNGGDAWVVARSLAAAGASVRIIEPADAKTPDAIAERALARECLTTDSVANELDPTDGAAAIVVDGLFGTGGRGELDGPFARCAAQSRVMRDRGATVVALDIPSGLDATTGGAGSDPDATISADCTLTFGTVKRGHLIRRDACGDIVVLDIGLGRHADLDDGAPRLIDDVYVAAHLPAIGADAHKGVRKKIAIVGGARGMAGATVLAARGAMRSGVGMVKLVVAPESLPVIQEAEPHALASAWPANAAEVEHSIAAWADAVVIGPGLGRSDESRSVLERVLEIWKGPILLDADAITLFEGRIDDLAALIGRRAAVLTPHPLEFSRVSGIDAKAILANRFDIAAPTAARLGATILLKGVPTIVTSPSGARLVSATGTPALATAGSGDVLSGIAGTVLAQTGDAFVAAAIGSFVHGRAAERVPNQSAVRGISLEDVVAELRESWSFDARPLRYPVLAELPAIGR